MNPNTPSAFAVPRFRALRHETTLHEFRFELRAWLAANFTADIEAAVQGSGYADADDSFAVKRRWNATLADAGYAAIGWPVEFGGRAAGLQHQLALNEEFAFVGAPGPVNSIGVANIAPAIMQYGTSQQQHQFLWPMLRGDTIWSQGMSEPEAGSDLASLACRAELVGDHFVVNGQKTWNSNGHRADWCQLYVRTNLEAPRHRGISALLVDMGTPGIEARPIRTMAGDTGFSELFFTNVRIPRSALLGEIDQGWSVATNTLSHERAGVASLYLNTRRTFDRLLATATKLNVSGTRAVDSPIARNELMRRYIEVRNLEFIAKRTLGAALQGRAPGAEGSIIKLAWSQASQALSRTAIEILGIEAMSGRWAQELLSSTSLSIAGGTTEVNKNIIGERVLGLPR